MQSSVDFGDTKLEHQKLPHIIHDFNSWKTSVKIPSRGCKNDGSIIIIIQVKFNYCADFLKGQ